MKKHSSHIAFTLGFGILSFIFLTVALTAIDFLLGGHVTPVWAIVSLLLAGTLVHRLLTRHATPRAGLWTAAFVVIIVACVAFSSGVIDPSADGNAYHKTAIGEMANGWNPVEQDINSFNKSAGNPFKLIGTQGLSRGFNAPWVDHYPKASWMFAANIYKLTGNIESGKVLTPLIMVDLFLFAFSYLYQKLNRNKTLLVSALLAFNPITMAEFYSYYVDGVLGNLLVILLLACTMLLDKKLEVPRRRLLIYGVIFMSAILAINLKFTGLAYVGIILACYWVYLLLTRRRHMLLQLSSVALAALAFGVLVVGASSYVKNMVNNGNPFYPLAGKNNLSFIAIEEPVGYDHMSYLHRFLKSNLAPMGQINHERSLEQGAPHVKIPFTVSLEEIARLDNIDARQAGYGVWFGGILIVSSAASVYLLVRSWPRRQERAYLPLFLLPLISIGICILGVDATWWARYLPQLPIFPIIVVVALYLRRETVLPNALVFAMLFNVTLMAVVGLSTQTAFQQATRQSFAQQLPCSTNSKQPTRIYSAVDLDGALYNVKDACPNIQLLTPQQFKAVPKDKQNLLYIGIYVIR